MNNEQLSTFSHLINKQHVVVAPLHVRSPAGNGRLAVERVDAAVVKDGAQAVVPAVLGAVDGGSGGTTSAVSWSLAKTRITLRINWSGTFGKRVKNKKIK